jgi:D-sedoheptulose 7-phosphate isomerase
MIIIKDRIQTTIQNMQKLISGDDTINRINESARIIINALKSGNKLMICGNGGSGANAQHMAGGFVCRFYVDRNPLPAIALTTDTSAITSITNDISFKKVLNRLVKADINRHLCF